MNEAHDRLEAELADLRPQDASPELRRRITDHRTRRNPPGSRRLALVLAGGLAAACGAAILLHWGSGWSLESKPTSVAGRNSSNPDHQVTPPHDDSARIAARAGGQGLPNWTEPPRFSWPLDNTLTSMIPPDLLE